MLCIGKNQFISHIYKNIFSIPRCSISRPYLQVANQKAIKDFFQKRQGRLLLIIIRVTTHAPQRGGKRRMKFHFYLPSRSHLMMMMMEKRLTGDLSWLPRSPLTEVITEPLCNG
ncbi:hypothetical protein CEXT_720111 [Caerostris extrusa]|uniref:Uncharacterized protein n=1 Tax=Caerostris extrusa TaxID=172846 RepID=A0AAV4SYF7_CAEEX|nr:hypothetical protein CEXT_720111 [Caerostris extrusa]